MTTNDDEKANDSLNPQPAMYSIARRPMDDSSDDDGSGPSTKPTIDLRLFKLNRKRCGGGGKGVVSRCTHLQRLCASLQYLDEWTARSGIEIAQERFAEFKAASYRQMTDDFTHFIKCHGDDLEEIAESIRKSRNMAKSCDIGKCANLRREHGRRRRGKGRRRRVKGKKRGDNMHVQYCAEIMDRFHTMVHHLYAMGLRLEKGRFDGVNGDDDEKGGFEHHGVDRTLKADTDLIARRKRQFAAAAPDIAEEADEQNKFSIGGGECVCTVLSEFKFFDRYFHFENNIKYTKSAETRCPLASDSIIGHIMRFLMVLPTIMTAKCVLNSLR